MSFSFRSTAAVIALGVTLGLSAAAAKALDAQQPSPPHGDAPKLQTQAPAPGDENQKAHEAISNPPQSGRTEPSATNSAGGHQTADRQQPDAVLVDGALNVPGAPQDSQTRPAKFSHKNDMLDHTPIMAQPLGLSDQQKHQLLEAVAAAKTPVQQVNAKAADSLPYGVAIHDLPDSIDNPRLSGLKYVQTLNDVLLVRPANRIVVAQIKK